MTVVVHKRKTRKCFVVEILLAREGGFPRYTRSVPMTYSQAKAAAEEWEKRKNDQGKPYRVRVDDARDEDYADAPPPSKGPAPTLS